MSDGTLAMKSSSRDGGFVAVGVEMDHRWRGLVVQMLRMEWENAHDHLLAAQERVANELASAQGDLSFRHDGGIGELSGCVEVLGVEKWSRSITHSD